MGRFNREMFTYGHFLGVVNPGAAAAYYRKRGRVREAEDYAKWANAILEKKGTRRQHRSTLYSSIKRALKPQH